jgi:hypothetical protein
MSEDPDTGFPGPRRGQFLFALIFLAVSTVLLAFLGTETTWAKGTDLVAQPAFWPAIGVIGMVGFSLLHLMHLPRRRLQRADMVEGRRWLTVLEFAGWFLAYVFIVPWAGYLPTTLVFLPLLLWRMGYRDPRLVGTGLVFGVAVVVLFKSVLQVRIPGGAVYELLPGALRSFFILNF